MSSGYCTKLGTEHCSIIRIVLCGTTFTLLKKICQCFVDAPMLRSHRRQRPLTDNKEKPQPHCYVATMHQRDVELVAEFTGPKDWMLRYLPIIELAMYVCMYVSHVLDRKLLERLMSPSPKSHSHESVILSNFWDSYFSCYGEFGEFSLRYTAPLSGRSLSNKAAHHITAKIGDAGCIRLHVCSTLQSRRRGLWTSLALLVGSGPLRDRRNDEQRGSPYDTKCNVAEIGAVNMGEIGAVRKRSR